jgi:hypothetical protein
MLENYPKAWSAIHPGICGQKEVNSMTVVNMLLAYETSVNLAAHKMRNEVHTIKPGLSFRL